MNCASILLCHAEFAPYMHLYSWCILIRILVTARGMARPQPSLTAWGLYSIAFEVCSVVAVDVCSTAISPVACKANESGQRYARCRKKRDIVPWHPGAWRRCRAWRGCGSAWGLRRRFVCRPSGWRRGDRGWGWGWVLCRHCSWMCWPSGWMCWRWGRVCGRCSWMCWRWGRVCGCWGWMCWRPCRRSWGGFDRLSAIAKEITQPSETKCPRRVILAVIAKWIILVKKFGTIFIAHTPLLCIVPRAPGDGASPCDGCDWRWEW